MYKYILSLFFLAAIVSCKNDVSSQFSNKPSALGRLNEVEIITDNDLWEGAIGDTINYYFGASYPIMPTPEPIFDLRHFTTDDLIVEPLRKELRTYLVVADLMDDDSPTTQMIRKDMGEERFINLRKKPYSSTIGREKWARNQILIYVMGNGEENIAKALRENFPVIAKKINEHDEEQLLASIFSVKRTNPGIENRINDMFGIQMSVPGDYKKVVEDKEKNIFWIRKDTRRGAIMNIMISKVPYKSQDQFEISSIKKGLNTLAQHYVKSNTPTSKMVINDEDLPVYDYTYDISGQYTKELRGVWEMTEDFKAGPFAGYAINLKEKSEILYVYAFIFGPGEQKRNLIQQLDYIVKTINVSEVAPTE